MNKILGSIIAILTLAIIASPVMAATVVNTQVHGNNVEFDFYTRMTHLDSDNFHGEGSTMDAWQTVRVGESSQWASDGADIDRYGEFSDGGELSTYSHHKSTAQWWPAESEQAAWVNSDDEGYLGQNTHWDNHFGGVKDVNQWKKQRTMIIGASCVYDLGFTSHDLRNDNWNFGFSAEGNGDADLFVDNAYATSEHGGGQYYTPDDYHSDWDFIWNGDLTQNTYARGNRGVDFTEHTDTTNNHIWGNSRIW